MSTDQVTVVVTGLGASTPLGGDVASTWSGLLAGASGARAITEEWAEMLPVRIAAPAAVDPGDVLDRVEARRLDRSAQLALIAAREAWQDAGRPEVAADRLAVVCASGIGGAITLLNAWDTLREKGARRVSPHTIPMLMPNSPAANIGLEVGAKGGVHTPVSACSSSAEAVANGMRMLRTGEVDVVVAGGTEAVIHPLPLAGFAAMMALSRRNDEPQRASRPFDKGRDGFVLGEGSGILVLETAEHAAARGAKVYAEVCGAGMSADAHHIAQPDPTGAGVKMAMRRALADAKLRPEQVRHVNAHATSTPVGDIPELHAMREVLGSAADDVLVTANKSALGHLLGGAGAVESIATILSLYHGVVPPTINLEDPDDEVNMTIVTGEPAKLPDGPRYALKGSFGFGGHNMVLAFGRN
jgi:3-oxoacyl-[acyl-carrier-protein] synthase II